jgi:Flp pilus assembly protein TadG
MLRALRPWRGFGVDRRGVAAIEFALVVPMVIVVYVTGFEIAQAATVYRKLTDTTVQLANVAAQYTGMSSGDVSTVMSASAQIMAPYSTTNLAIVLSEVTTNASGAGSVTWSKTYQGTALATGAAVTMPTGFQAANTNYIMVQTTYSYSPTFGTSLIGPIAMSNKIFMLPRSSSSIPFTG